MANPTIQALSGAAAEALAGTLHAGTGITHIPSNVSSADSPSVLAWLKNVERMIFDHIAGSSQGRVVLLTGLNVGAFAMHYRIGATDYTFDGDDSFAVTADETNHLYLDADETLKTSISGWPGGDHVKLAVAVAGAGSISSLTDERWRNFQLGIVNAWSSVAATQDADMDGFGLLDLGELRIAAGAELTIASGVVTPAGLWHTVDTESDAASDDLVTITADAAQVGRLLMIQCANAARVTTLRSTGNVTLMDGPDLVLDSTSKMVLLQQHTTTAWRVMATNFNDLSKLVRELDCQGHRLSDIGAINIGQDTATLASGTLTLPTGAVEVLVRSEVELNSDTLTTISGGSEGDVIILRTGAAALGEIITIDDAAGNIALNGGDWVMTSDVWMLALRLRGSVWTELFRSPVSAETMAEAGDVVPHTIRVHYPGALADNQATYVERVGTPFTVVAARGRVVTAPSGGSCVVDILKNGASIFAAAANAINITTGNTGDTSDEVYVEFDTNDELTVKVLTASSAASLTVSIEAYAAVTP